jgi:hypothetical protein
MDFIAGFVASMNELTVAVRNGRLGGLQERRSLSATALRAASWQMTVLPVGRFITVHCTNNLQGEPLACSAARIASVVEMRVLMSWLLEAVASAQRVRHLSIRLLIMAGYWSMRAQVRGGQRNYRLN